MNRPPVQECAAAALGDEQLFPRGIVDGADLSLAVDLERQRRAEDRQAMRVVVRAVDRIEDPAVRRAARGRILAELFRKDGVIGKPLRNHLAEHRLDRDVGFGDEIDRSFVRHLEAALDEAHLNLAGLDDRLDGGREQQRVLRHSPGRMCLVIRTSMPPWGARRIDTSSMNWRIRKTPRPLVLSMFSGVSGFLIVSGSKPGPWSRTVTMKSAGSGSGVDGVIDEDDLGRVAGVAVGDGVDDRLAHRHRRPVQRFFVEAQAARNVFRDRLDQVERFYRAVNLEMHILEAAGHRVRRSIVSRWLQSPLRR